MQKGFINTIATKVDHDVSLSVHDACKGERSDVTPDFKSTEERVIDCLLIQVRAMTQDPKEDRDSKLQKVISHSNIKQGQKVMKCFPEAYSRLCS